MDSSIVVAIIAVCGSLFASACTLAGVLVSNKNSSEKTLYEIKSVKDDVDELCTKVTDLDEQVKDLTKTTDDNFKIVKKTLQDDVRQTLKEIHDKCVNEDYVSEHLYFIFNQLCQDYIHGLGGNSFVEDYWDDMATINAKSRKKDGKKDGQKSKN